MRSPSAVRLLGLGGLVAAGLVSLGGFLNAPLLVGVSGGIMVVANAYALVVGDRRRP